ncbi:MAG: hypothetical protein ACLQU4_08130 [Limisphaerales bacterium]
MKLSEKKVKKTKKGQNLTKKRRILAQNSQKMAAKRGLFGGPETTPKPL